MSPSNTDGAERPPATSRAGRSWRVTLLALASLLVLLAVVGYVHVSNRATDRGEAELTAGEATPAWRGEGSELPSRGSVEVRGVRMTASEVQCGLPRHDWQGGRAQASGHFCVVDIELRNDGEAALVIAPAVFALIDGEGAPFVADERVTAYGTDLPPSLPSSRELPLGAATRIHLVFDVPADASGPMELRFTPSEQLSITV
ncbi:DUF4352 domain-containing protein [Pseudoclavibacter terrae]|uniref:DUF4352 domain-containing protein n=1 Tax=Pseudoclavibacter terrae TaxID=1530195 RepID=UPI00232F10C1|nr:DUF4352 domain-containing protein [Pseudoclavibacter terrae]